MLTALECRFNTGGKLYSYRLAEGCKVPAVGDAVHVPGGIAYVVGVHHNQASNSRTDALRVARPVGKRSMWAKPAGATSVDIVTAHYTNQGHTMTHVEDLTAQLKTAKKAAKRRAKQEARAKAELKENARLRKAALDALEQSAKYGGSPVQVAAATAILDRLPKP